MCCLTNEEETYEELNSRLPAVGDMVTTPEKLRGEVQSINVLRQLVKVVVQLDDDEKRNPGIQGRRAALPFQKEEKRNEA